MADNLSDLVRLRAARNSGRKPADPRSATKTWFVSSVLGQSHLIAPGQNRRREKAMEEEVRKLSELLPELERSVRLLSAQLSALEARVQALERQPGPP